MIWEAVRGGSDGPGWSLEAPLRSIGAAAGNAGTGRSV